MKVFILLGIITFVCAKQQVDQLDCSIKGPQYWCKNEETAKECLAVSYCREYIWEKENRPDRLMQVVEKPEYIKFTLEGSPNADICTYCKANVKVIHTFLSKQKPQDMVKVMEVACKFLQSPLKEQCLGIVESMGTFIIQVLVTWTKDPNAICTKIHLCPSGSNVLNKIITIKSPNAEVCTICQQVLGTIHMVVSNNETQAMIISEIAAACNYLSSAERFICEEAVNLYAPNIINMILKYTQDPRPLCQMLHLCPQGKSVMKIDMKSPNDACDSCKETVGTIHTFLVTNNATIIAEIGKSCEFLPPSVQSMCKAYASKIFNDAVDYTKDPVALCTMLHLCSGNGKVTPSKFHPVIQVNGGIECEFCKYAAQGLDSLLNSTQGQEKVKDVLLEICSQLPSTVGAECTSLVDEYFDQVIKFLIEKLGNPEELCKELGMCSSQRKIKEEKSVKVNGVVSCEVCELLMEKLDTMLKGNRTKEVIKKNLDKLCADFPWSKQCSALVDKCADQIVDLLVVELKNTEKVCTSLGLCLSIVNKISIQDVSQKHEKNGFVECETCTLSMKLLIREAKGELTEKVVKNILDRLCQLIPDKEKQAQCIYLVNKYASEIINMVTKGLDAEYICKKLGYCDTSSLKAITHHNDMQMDIVDNELPTCNLCMFMTGKLDSLFQGGAGKKRVKSVIRKVCHKTKLTEEKRGDCQRLMDENKDMIIKLAKKVNLPSLCKRIGHCVSRHRFNTVPTFLALRKPNYSGGTCLICKYLVGVLDAALSQRSAKTKIIDVVHNLCNKLPREIFVTECNALISEYGSEIIQLLVDNVLAPVDICQHFGLC